MKYTYIPKGVCSRKIEFELDDKLNIINITVTGGCNGNLKGICNLLKGQNAKEVISKLKGTTCNFKSTSCPDQIAIALEEALKKEE